MCSGMGDRTCLLPGFPIRTSPDQSSVDSSPGLFAASHVLLRLLVPRHPPCALTNLATKMLASTVQFSSYGRAQLRAGAAHAHIGAPFGEKLVRRAENPPTPKRRAGSERPEEASAPSGPNSVPGPTRSADSVPTLLSCKAQEGCTRKSSASFRPTGQCSTP